MADNGGYSHSQITTMQQDAVRRVHEMQRRAQATVSPANSDPINTYEAPSIIPITEKSPKRVATAIPQNQIAQPMPPISPMQSTQSTQSNFLSGGIEGLLDKFGLDNERLIIIGILLLLFKDGADNMLLLALVYILL